MVATQKLGNLVAARAGSSMCAPTLVISSYALHREFYNSVEEVPLSLLGRNVGANSPIGCILTSVARKLEPLCMCGAWGWAHLSSRHPVSSGAVNTFPAHIHVFAGEVWSISKAHRVWRSLFPLADVQQNSRQRRLFLLSLLHMNRF